MQKEKFLPSIPTLHTLHAYNAYPRRRGWFELRKGMRMMHCTTHPMHTPFLEDEEALR